MRNLHQVCPKRRVGDHKTGYDNGANSSTIALLDTMKITVVIFMVDVTAMLPWKPLLGLLGAGLSDRNAIHHRQCAGI